MSYEEEDACMRRIHVRYEERMHACHMRRRIHACHMRRRIHVRYDKEDACTY